ncbi:MAG: yeaC [Chlamydiales bacterium]|jgi:MoxR-like ATPase|nr:yeaC [Chlamydiales bacterium]
MDLNKLVADSSQHFIKLREQIQTVIVGQQNLIDRLIIALLTGGHVLIEGAPGLAKTLAVTILAQAVQCQCKRIQFTPDLLPSDLLGTAIYQPKEERFQIKKGPIFTQIVIADEINRAPAKVQSALLEAMGERTVTIYGETFQLSTPFCVFATQNPLEYEGTYPLSEAQLDRFMFKTIVPYPQREEERQIIHRMAAIDNRCSIDSVISAEEIVRIKSTVNAIYIDEKVVNYILDIIFATRDPQKYRLHPQKALEQVASPRATLSLVLASKAYAFLNKRAYVTPYDVRSIAHDVLRHRLALSHEALIEGYTVDLFIDKILNTVAIP